MRARERESDEGLELIHSILEKIKESKSPTNFKDSWCRTVETPPGTREREISTAKVRRMSSRQRFNESEKNKITEASEKSAADSNVCLEIGS